MGYKIADETFDTKEQIGPKGALALERARRELPFMGFPQSAMPPVQRRADEIYAPTETLRWRLS